MVALSRLQILTGMRDRAELGLLAEALDQQWLREALEHPEPVLRTVLTAVRRLPQAQREALVSALRCSLRTEERRFLQDKFEKPGETIQFTPEGKKAILAAVLRGEGYEEFLAKKYVGTKRFGLDGGESMIPALEAVIKHGGSAGVREIIYGMAHRGRLNVLANVMAKPYRVIFHDITEQDRESFMTVGEVAEHGFGAGGGRG